jgi:CO dehydrogenase/acetyl-CoA synthase beta subunit
MSGEDHQEASDAVVEARLAEVTARAGGLISAQQRDQVKTRIERAVELGQKVRATPMANGDEPEVVFQPYRREGGRA